MFFPFVILKHSGWVTNERGDHWDWLIDLPNASHPIFGSTGALPNDVIPTGLVSFACDRNPSLGWAGHLLQRMPLHRRDYLTYEGPVAGNRGEVRRVASGQLEWIAIESFSLRFVIVSMEFTEVTSKAWAFAPYCLAACDQPHAGGRPWYHSEPDPTSLWLLQYQP